MGDITPCGVDAMGAGCLPFNIKPYRKGIGLGCVYGEPLLLSCFYCTVFLLLSTSAAVGGHKTQEISWNHRIA